HPPPHGAASADRLGGDPRQLGVVRRRGGRASHARSAPGRGPGLARRRRGVGPAMVGARGRRGAGRDARSAARDAGQRRRVAPAAAGTRQVRGREVGRALAAPGSTVSIALPPGGPGWWVGAATLDADELRADDRRVFAWRVAPPARVTASSGAGPFVAAALAVLEQGEHVRRGTDVVIGDRLDGGAAVSVVLPPADPTLIGQLNRALAARGARWRLGSAGTPGPVAASAVAGMDGIQVARRYRLDGAGDGGRGNGEDSTVLARENGEPWLVRDVLCAEVLDAAAVGSARFAGGGHGDAIGPLLVLALLLAAAELGVATFTR